jgi:two-component system nitrate/nitrite response regulator NarL
MIDLDAAGDRWKARNLTAREVDVIRLVAQAKANKIIAFELGLTEGTVKEYLNHVYSKTGIHNRIELAFWVRDNHI